MAAKKKEDLSSNNLSFNNSDNNQVNSNSNNNNTTHTNHIKIKLEQPQKQSTETKEPNWLVRIIIGGLVTLAISALGYFAKNLYSTQNHKLHIIENSNNRR